MPASDIHAYTKKKMVKKFCSFILSSFEVHILKTASADFIVKVHDKIIEERGLNVYDIIGDLGNAMESAYCTLTVELGIKFLASRWSQWTRVHKRIRTREINTSDIARRFVTTNDYYTLPTVTKQQSKQWEHIGSLLPKEAMILKLSEMSCGGFLVF